MNVQAELVLDAKTALGEGSFWDSRSKLLYWVDIEGRAIHVYDPATNQDTLYSMKGRPGTLVPRERGGLVVAVEQEVLVLDRVDGQPQELCRFEAEPEGNRLNDGKCGPAGRFWVGTMSASRDPNGTLYCVEPDGSYRSMLTGVTVSNGIVWTADEKTMYYIDTAAECVRAFDYRKDDGTISAERTIVEVPGEMGRPDGMAIDAEGMIWVAMFRGSAVRRFNPTNGTLLDTVELPASNVTSCAFGGDDLRDLYITTARAGLTDDAARQQPLAGGLFRARVETPGVLAHLFAG
ncbi:MAG: SMP-30/gluconolactonase/LRE family protein [Spirochaetota bacterium]